MALTELSAGQHAAAMADYLVERSDAAAALGSRGPVRYDADGNLHPGILAEFETNGFYIFEGVIDLDEVTELRNAVEDTIERAPSPPDSDTDAQGRPALGLDYPISPYIFIKPLSDPWGGTKLLSGRHPVKMTEPTPDDNAPDHVVHLLLQMCTSMPAALRLYGHPDLLSIAEAINGPDFVPYNDSIFVKKPGMGGSVAWHQDGATHWDNPRWHPGIHGFNFQVQLYSTTPANALWIVPGSHAEGRIDIRALVSTNEGGERLPDAIPLVTGAGDVTIVSRQMLHGSFANTSPDPRVSITFGFYPHSSVLGVSGGGVGVLCPQLPLFVSNFFFDLLDPALKSDDLLVDRGLLPLQCRQLLLQPDVLRPLEIGLHAELLLSGLALQTSSIQSIGQHGQVRT
mgnify:CR=1 FL=1